MKQAINAKQRINSKRNIENWSKKRVADGRALKFFCKEAHYNFDVRVDTRVVINDEYLEINLSRDPC